MAQGVIETRDRKCVTEMRDREASQATAVGKCVGWVERSETHHQNQTVNLCIA